MHEYKYLYISYIHESTFCVYLNETTNCAHNVEFISEKPTICNDMQNQQVQSHLQYISIFFNALIIFFIKQIQVLLDTYYIIW